MAIVGQCRACHQAVSDEAASCPRCGQPNPCVLPPSVGAVQLGSVTGWAGEACWEVTLSSGITGFLTAETFDAASRKHVATLKVGASCRVKITQVKNGIVLMKPAL